jgi:hypothetical protein
MHRAVIYSHDAGRRTGGRDLEGAVMATVEELVTRLPIDQIAAQLGVDRDTAVAASREASEALVQGMQANAQDQAGAASLAKAIAAHAKQVADKSADDIDVAAIDTADGEKIVKNVFGDNEEQVVNQLGGLGGGSGLFKSLLPMLAPIVMGYLGKQAAGGRAQQAGDDGGGLDDIVGGLLGGGDGGGGLGDMLGGLLGGGGGGGGGLGDLLGGLLGGGKR